ncbi:hypothetical protein AVEN_116089-1 [Araneus ventricosus]|uniref:Uncharacterized protein n=1 Tax=Araneus ventricosus TaxID=182803 RepID=A0A4Y2VV52_ARAVE|nr:hypothetical protein AVEN_116089-1 [Araneus ventricosus]
MFLKVTIENYRNTPGATQCWNYNQFDHSSANCGFTTGCLICVQEHRISDCTITTPQDNSKCINCGVEGHIASWRGCPAFAKIKATKGQGVNYPKVEREFVAAQYKKQENTSYAQQAQKFFPRQVELNATKENNPTPPSGNGQHIEK